MTQSDCDVCNDGRRCGNHNRTVRGHRATTTIRDEVQAREAGRPGDEWTHLGYVRGPGEVPAYGELRVRRVPEGTSVGSSQGVRQTIPITSLDLMRVVLENARSERDRLRRERNRLYDLATRQQEELDHEREIASDLQGRLQAARSREQLNRQLLDKQLQPGVPGGQVTVGPDWRPPPGPIGYAASQIDAVRRRFRRTA